MALSKDQIKTLVDKLVVEVIKKRYEELVDSFPTKEEFDAWLDEQIAALKDTLTVKMTAFFTKFEAFQSQLISMTGAVATFIPAGATYLASAGAMAALGNVSATAQAVIDYNTAASQLSTSVDSCTMAFTELEQEATGLGIINLPGFSELWSALSSIVNTYINTCSMIKPISG